MKTTYAMSLAKKGDSFYWDFKIYNPYKTNNISLSPSETPIYDIRSTLRSYGIQQDVVQRIKKEEKLIVKRIELEKKRKAELQAQKERMEKAKKEYNEKMEVVKQQVNLRNEFRQAAYGCGIKNRSEEEEVELKSALIFED
jgi:preprotein translocase subunit SecF